MATFDYYNVVSCRQIVSLMSGSGYVFYTQPNPVIGGGSPYTVAYNGNTFRFYSGPVGGPHPPWVGGLGVLGDYQAYSGFRSANYFTPVVYTAYSDDPVYNSGIQAGYSNTQTKGMFITLINSTSVDGSNLDYQQIAIVAHYAPGLGSWNYKVSLGGEVASGGVRVSGISLSPADIELIAEALGGMIQIVNNINVGDQLSPDIQDATAQLSALAAALGAGGILGSLGATGNIGTALSKLDQLTSIISSIGSIADAVIEYQQLGKLDAINTSLGSISGFIDNLETSLGANLIALRERIRGDGEGSLADAIGPALGNIAANSGNISNKSAEIAAHLNTTWDGVPYNVPAAIAAFAGGGGGGAVDLTTLIAKLEEIRAIMAAGGGSISKAELEEVLAIFWQFDSGVETLNLAQLIAMLLNHSTINFG